MVSIDTAGKETGKDGGIVHATTIVDEEGRIGDYRIEN
jgi:hypothetical protein